MDSAKGFESRPHLNRVGILPLGEVPVTALRVMAANIGAYLGLSARVLPPASPPADARSPSGQYDAARIICELESSHAGADEKLVAVTEADLYVPLFAYVLGEARQGGRCAVISFHRLRMGNPGHCVEGPRFLERVAKVAIHELGHLHNLVHCTSGRCVMNFSEGIEDLDGIPFYLCRYCIRTLREAALTGATDGV